MTPATWKSVAPVGAVVKQPAMPCQSHASAIAISPHEPKPGDFQRGEPPATNARHTGRRDR